MLTTANLSPLPSSMASRLRCLDPASACTLGRDVLLARAMYTRWFRIGGQSIIAGCGMATTLLKVYMLRVFDSLSRYHPGIDLHTYVDDVDLASQKSEASQAADVLAAAARMLVLLLCWGLAFERTRARAVSLVRVCAPAGFVREVSQS